MASTISTHWSVTSMRISTVRLSSMPQQTSSFPDMSCLVTSRPVSTISAVTRTTNGSWTTSVSSPILDVSITSTTRSTISPVPSAVTDLPSSSRRTAGATSGLWVPVGESLPSPGWRAPRPGWTMPRSAPVTVSPVTRMALANIISILHGHTAFPVGKQFQTEQARPRSSASLLPDLSTPTSPGSMSTSSTPVSISPSSTAGFPVPLTTTTTSPRTPCTARPSRRSQTWRTRPTPVTAPSSAIPV